MKTTLWIFMKWREYLGGARISFCDGTTTDWSSWCMLSLATLTYHVCQKSGKGVLYSIPFDNYFIVFSLTYQRCFGSCFSLYHFINNLLHQLCIIGVFVEFYWNVRETIFSFQHLSDFYYLSSQEMTCAYEKTKKQTQFKWEISIDYHPKRFLNF